MTSDLKYALQGVVDTTARCPGATAGAAAEWPAVG